VLCQPVGHRPENADVMYNSGRDVWAPELRARRPEITTESIEALQVRLPRPSDVTAYLAPARAWPRAAASHRKSSARKSASASYEWIGVI
jgi:hypothetical protein